jgi:Na+/H+-translocating membrane pyrophosphatase
MDDALGFWTLAPLVAGCIALVIAAFFYVRVKGLPEGNEAMQRIAGYIREGAMAFLVRPSTRCSRSTRWSCSGC